ASTLADCTYRDPLAHKQGHADLIGYMLAFHQQTPGGHFVTRRYQHHHGRSLIEWDMVDGTGTKLGEGASFAEYAPDGRLRTMTGFFETPPESAG
ncbi:MAG: nuclear transport factor 2 family protein, partial [Myxococcota bacterium]